MSAEEIRELRERLIKLEAQREVDREQDTMSRHAFMERTQSSIASFVVLLQDKMDKNHSETSAQLRHQDACTDSVRNLAAEAQKEVQQVKVDVAGIKSDVEKMRKEQTKMGEAINALSPLARAAANRSPAVVAGLVVVDIFIAHGRAKGWW